MKFTLMIIIAVFAGQSVARADEKATISSAQQAARKIDAFLESHWKTAEIHSAPVARDAAFLRRITLDLAGRVPTSREVVRFLSDESADKRQHLIERLVDGPEFPLHFGNVLDQMIQGRHAGNKDFVDYLRKSVRKQKSWDVLFREMMIGPWDGDGQKIANRFIDKRAKNLDSLTVDATRVFFGVDISCAKCHDHPLVDDWKQDHFYGMASFFNRTTGGKGKVGEKKDGEVKFLGADGKEKTAKVMFLSGLVVEVSPGDDPPRKQTGDNNKPAHISRRQQLVTVALKERVFFSRSFVNRMWEYFFGSGLVDPVDQIHSGNAPAVDGLLQWLAEDFAASGYDIQRLMAAIVSTRAYGLSSQWPDDSTIPAETTFAVARLRPLTRRQLALSLLLVTGAGDYDSSDDETQRVERYLGVNGIGKIQKYLAFESQTTALIRAFDSRNREFQSSASEALFMSNNEAVQKLVRAEGDNLTARLSRMSSSKQIVEAAVKSVFSRPPRDSEGSQLVEWFDQQHGDRSDVCARLVWALVTSAEFRFNH
jgi:hypothetical protein